MRGFVRTPLLRLAVFPRPIKELLNDFDVAFSGELLSLVTALCKLLLLDKALKRVVALSAHIRVVLVLLSIGLKVALREDVVSRGGCVLVAPRTGKLAFTLHQTTSPVPPCNSHRW